MSAPQQPVHCPDFVPSGAHYARELMPKAVYDGTKIAKAQLPEGFQPTDYTVICGKQVSVVPGTTIVPLGPTDRYPQVVVKNPQLQQI